MDTTARDLCHALDGVQTPNEIGLDIPSPASDLDIFTPGVEQESLASVISNQWPSSNTRIASTVAPIPDIVDIQHPARTPTFELEHPTDLQFDTLVGAQVDPAPSSPVLPSAKAGSCLRLNLAQLGIGAPHSEQVQRPPLARSEHFLGDLSATIPKATADFDSITSGVDPRMDDALHNHVYTLQPELSPESQIRAPALHTPLHHYVTTLTPPDDNGRITWESITKIATGPMNSPTVEEGMMPSDTVDVASAEQAQVPQLTVQGSTPTGDAPLNPWLKGVINVMLSNIRSAKSPYERPIKVLSHALPCPSTEGHAFPAIISSLHDQTPTSPTCWINVFHALPGRFNLADLPTSPPSTPGPPIGGDDYFTSKIFDTAVQILDYADNLKSLPQSPRPIVPPSSVDVSIVERYIPPTNTNEFMEMFNTRGPSLLVDRLVELSPENGTLVFIYPTKRGAQTFMHDYLAPVLDPILRSMVVVNGFSADLGLLLGKMSSVESLPDHETMKRNILGLCSTLSTSGTRMEKFQKQPSKFSLVYAAQEEVVLDRKIWAESWWAKQEKPRIREVISKCFRKANRAQEDQTPVSLVHEVLDGVANRPYQDGKDVQSGIEVSAFVITRSK